MTNPDTTRIVPELVQIGALIEAGTYSRLRALAKQEDRSIASVIRRAVEREIQLAEEAA